MLGFGTASSDNISRGGLWSYLLSCISFPMEMRCEDSLSDSFKALLVGLLNARDRSQALYKTTILVLNAVCGVLADLVDKRHRFHRCSCLEEDHCLEISSMPPFLLDRVVHLQHWVSSLTEVNRGFTAGLRISASSFLISASMSSPASESSPSAVPLAACSPYSFVAYYGSISSGHPGTNAAAHKSAWSQHTNWNRSRKSATVGASFFMAHVAQIPTSPGLICRASAFPLLGISHFFLP